MAAGRETAWAFKRVFRRHAFGWRSQPAMQRVKQAVAEVRRAARTDPMLGAEGAVAFLERVAPAIERVDGSSGAMGTAVNRAVEELSGIIAAAPADPGARRAWLERLWTALEEDHRPVLERLGGEWGKLCATKEIASEWADRLVGPVREVWGSRATRHRFIKSGVPCLSALVAAGRYEETLELFALNGNDLWFYRRWAVLALVGLGRKAEALRLAESGSCPSEDWVDIARTCEEILLSSGLADEAYRRYGFQANAAGTRLAIFRAVARRYPGKCAAEILADLVGARPGEEGLCFEAAMEAGLRDEALRLARLSPCDPKALIRAARDFAEKDPGFAVEAGLIALHWLKEGNGPELPGPHVLRAGEVTIGAAFKLGRTEQVLEEIRRMASTPDRGGSLLRIVLGRYLGMA